jgi:excisionase family DNA binding protein
MSSCLLTKKQVAAMLSVCPTTVERLVHKYHALPAFRVGSDLRFDPDDIKRYLENCRVATVGGTESVLIGK